VAILYNNTQEMHEFCQINCLQAQAVVCVLI
jgi:hypothetical protein